LIPFTFNTTRRSVCPGAPDAMTELPVDNPRRAGGLATYRVAL